MSYQDDHGIRRVVDHDRTTAREAMERIRQDVHLLTEIIGRTLGRDTVDTSRGFTFSFNGDKPSSGEDVPGLGVGVAIMCATSTGECVGVMDDFAGVSRPCTAAEATKCLQCGVEATDPEVLKTLPPF